MSSSPYDQTAPTAPTPAPKPKRRRGWLKWAIPLLTFFLGFAVGNSGSKTQTASTPASTVTATTTATTTTTAAAGKAAPADTTTVTVTKSAEAPAAPATTQDSAKQWTSGTYEVGTGKDIAPGKYKVTPDGGGMCYWATLKDADGSTDSIIANDNIQGPTVLVIKPSVNYFQINGCVVTKA